MIVLNAISDDKSDNRPLIVLNNVDPNKWNEINLSGYGVFHTVNEFSSTVRRECYLKKLKYFYVDFDSTTKDEQMKKILDFLLPTAVIESKNGYHVYWGIKDDLILEHGLENALKIYKYINSNLCKMMGSDQLKDAARLLRTPNFYHMKNKNDPFLVKEVFSNGPSYYAKDFYAFLPQEKEKTIETKTIKKDYIAVENEVDEFWRWANSLDCKSSLERLSGSSYVNGEIFEVPIKGNIKVNGKVSGAWIDKNGLIGSTKNGGPTIVNWLMFYGHSKGEVAKIIKEVFNYENLSPSRPNLPVLLF